MVRFLFALFDFRIHHLDDDPGAERKPSHERLPLRDAVHLVGAFGELFEDLFFLVVHPLLQVFFVPDNVTEGDEANYKVSDFWLFQYNTNGVLTGKPRYYENAQDGVNVSVFRPSSGTYKCYIIANTHNPGFLSEIKEYTTEADLRRAYKAVTCFSDLWPRLVYIQGFRCFH